MSELINNLDITLRLMLMVEACEPDTIERLRGEVKKLRRAK